MELKEELKGQTHIEREFWSSNGSTGKNCH